MRNAGLDELQAGIKTASRNINNVRYADDTTLMAKSEEELNSPLMRVKGNSEKAGLKLNTQKAKIMACYPITSHQGEKVEAVMIFFSWSPKSLQMVTAAMKLKEPLKAPWKKNCDKPRQHIKKQRHHKGLYC